MADSNASPDGPWGLRGLWQYLRARIDARKEVQKAGIALEKERERNRAALAYLKQLPTGAEMADYEDSGGRRIWIRKDGLPIPRTFPPCPSPVVIFIPETARHDKSANDGSGPVGEIVP